MALDFIGDGVGKNGSVTCAIHRNGKTDGRSNSIAILLMSSPINVFVSWSGDLLHSGGTRASGPESRASGPGARASPYSIAYVPAVRYCLYIYIYIYQYIYYGPFAIENRQYIYIYREREREIDGKAGR